jgi:hypothetical protein
MTLEEKQLAMKQRQPARRGRRVGQRSEPTMGDVRFYVMLLLREGYGEEEACLRAWEQFDVEVRGEMIRRWRDSERYLENLVRSGE